MSIATPAPYWPESGATSTAAGREVAGTVWADRWLTLLGVVLLGYALGGRGFGYLGIPPLFISEVLLASGMVALLLFGRWQGMLESPGFIVMLLFGAWGALRTEVFQYGQEALRDAVVWGYSSFAVIVYGLILAKPARLAGLLRKYAVFAKIFLVCMPVIWIGVRMISAAPHWPWVEVPMLEPNGGAALTHTAGIFAFGVAGFAGRVSTVRLLLIGLLLVVIGVYDRAGTVSFLTACAFCFLCKPHHDSFWRLLGYCAAGLVLLMVSGLRVDIPERERELSFDQLLANFGSLTGDVRTGDLDATKEWRLNWWKDIASYTFDGRFFWTGKGYGINLTLDDGYGGEDESFVLRSPHNGHMTILARVGVPGFVLWILVQISWAGGLLGGYIRSTAMKERYWPGLFLCLLAYWIAFMVNANFDVFLEGPMGGIWYWTLYGVGMASLYLYRHDPTLLERTWAESTTEVTPALDPP